MKTTAFVTALLLGSAAAAPKDMNMMGDASLTEDSSLTHDSSMAGGSSLTEDSSLTNTAGGMANNKMNMEARQAPASGPTLGSLLKAVEKIVGSLADEVKDLKDPAKDLTDAISKFEDAAGKIDVPDSK